MGIRMSKTFVPDAKQFPLLSAQQISGKCSAKKRETSRGFPSGWLTKRNEYEFESWLWIQVSTQGHGSSGMFLLHKICAFNKGLPTLCPKKQTYKCGPTKKHFCPATNDTKDYSYFSEVAHIRVCMYVHMYICVCAAMLPLFNLRFLRLDLLFWLRAFLLCSSCM